jgi:uncharacterized protein YjdB
MKNIQIVIAALCVAVLSSCSVTMPYAVTNNTIGDKVGKSETTIIFGTAIASGSSKTLGLGVMVTNKNYGIVEAIKDGDISSVATVDLKVTNFLLWQKVEVIVTGE